MTSGGMKIINIFRTRTQNISMDKKTIVITGSTRIGELGSWGDSAPFGRCDLGDSARFARGDLGDSGDFAPFGRFDSGDFAQFGSVNSRDLQISKSFPPG